uniref:Uncharacterized protein n=1 Tax=Glossina austeni TaxID=7395 RepID=A0A1A9UL19_GLOAU
MLYYFEKGWKAARLFRDLNELFGEGTISGRSGRSRPSDFDDQSLLAAIERDEDLATQMLDDNFNIDHSTHRSSSQNAQKVDGDYDQSLLAAIERDEDLATQMLDDNFNVDHSTIVRRLKMLKKWMVTTLRVNHLKVK